MINRRIAPFMDKTADEAIGKTILKQMGGSQRLQMMLGVKEFLFLTNGVAFAWPNKTPSKGNYLAVKLNGLDLYDMTFSMVGRGAKKTVKVFNDIYAEDLKGIFEKQTGWYLRMASEQAHHLEYQQTPEDKAIAAKATKVLHELAMLLPEGRVVESADAFFSDFSDSNGEPLTAAWWGVVRGEHSEEIDLKIDQDIKDGTYTVRIRSSMSGTGAYKAINTVLEKPPFKTDVSVGQVSRILDEVVPRVRKGLDAARSTAGAIKQKYDWLTSEGKVFHRNLEGLVSRFGWGVQFYSGSHSYRDGQPSLDGSVEITGIVTPEVYAMKNPEQRRALSPFVAKARTLVQKAAASVKSVQIVVSKKPGYFSQGGLNFGIETHHLPGRDLFGSQQGGPAMSLRQQIQRIASEYPETRVHLVPLLKSWAR